MNAELFFLKKAELTVTRFWSQLWRGDYRIAHRQDTVICLLQARRANQPLHDKAYALVHCQSFQRRNAGCYKQTWNFLLNNAHFR